MSFNLNKMLNSSMCNNLLAVGFILIIIASVKLLFFSEEDESKEKFQAIYNADAVESNCSVGLCGESNPRIRSANYKCQEPAERNGCKLNAGPQGDLLKDFKNLQVRVPLT